MYRHITKKTRKKLQHKAMKSILMRYELESEMYRVYHSQNDSIAISRDLLIFENKINVMTKHSSVNFSDIFDDIDEKASTADVKSIFEEIIVLSSFKVTVSATSMSQEIASSILSSATFSSSILNSTSVTMSSEVPSETSPESSIRITLSVELSSRSERRDLRDQPSVSY